MKIILAIIFTLFVKVSLAQNFDANLNGKIFKGTATEITPPEIDRLPLIYEELIIFDNGKVDSKVLTKYSVNKLSFSSEIDDRRMIALKVVKFNSYNSRIIDGKNATVEFNGEVIGDSRLSGNLIIRYTGGMEVKFIVIAETE